MTNDTHASRKIEIRARSIFANAPDAMLLVAADGSILKANLRAELLLGYTHGELVGQAVEVLLPDHLRERHRHVHRAAFASRPASRPMNSGYELVARTKGGWEVPVEISLAPLGPDADGEVIVVIRDVTERRRAAELLAERGAQLNALFELSPDGMATIDKAGRVAFANPAFLRMTSLPASDVVGHPLEIAWRLLRERAANPEQWPGLGELLAESGVDANGTDARHRLELRYPHKAVLELARGKIAGESVGHLLYVRDLTHEVETDRLKSEFLSHAAHELRTPMAGIYGFSELLMTQEFDEATRQDLLSGIHTQTERLIDIINELLDLVRIEERRGMDFRIEAVSLAPFVGEVAAAMNIDPVRWPLAVESDAGLPPVRADAAKLRRALTNVLGNAIKYSPKGGAIEIRCGAHDSEGNHIGIAVTDHGIGMRPDQVVRVGERFYRADTSGNIPGTGLGMAIVKEIVALHGGGFAIDSAVGVGTTVTLWLPADARLPPATSNPSQEQS